MVVSKIQVNHKHFGCTHMAKCIGFGRERLVQASIAGFKGLDKAFKPSNACLQLDVSFSSTSIATSGQALAVDRNAFDAGLLARATRVALVTANLAIPT